MKNRMVTGTVKFYNGSRGFGFIIRDDGAPDVYVNAQDVKGGMLSERDKVEFDVEQAERGPRARNVKKV
ncbi:MAG: cold shock domain-containing protein [Aigarchaeota archaeon]|nr:cold shock domain-containing protein [Aigarchaeota archaeon]